MMRIIDPYIVFVEIKLQRFRFTVYEISRESREWMLKFPGNEEPTISGKLHKSLKMDRVFGIFYLGCFIRGWKNVPVPQLLCLWRDPNSNLICGVPRALRRIHIFLFFEKMLKSTYFKVLDTRGCTRKIYVLLKP